MNQKQKRYFGAMRRRTDAHMNSIFLSAISGEAAMVQCIFSTQCFFTGYVDLSSESLIVSLNNALEKIWNIFNPNKVATELLQSYYV